MSVALAGRRIAVPETRELDVFAQMLERHGANLVRCPLVAIRDVPDPAPVVAWLRRFTINFPDDFILLTGEGLERLVGFARRAGMEEVFITALTRVRKITRGPKPVRRLRALGLQTDLAAEPPTTAGIIASLSNEDLAGRRVAIQLYPDNPNLELLNFLHAAGANPDPVLCYLYGSEAEDQRVIELIDEMAAGGVDLIAFTSSPQVRRLRRVAKESLDFVPVKVAILLNDRRIFRLHDSGHRDAESESSCQHDGLPFAPPGNLICAGPNLRAS